MCYGAPPAPSDPSYDEVLANNFTLAPEVCLSGWGYPPPRFQLLEMAKCVVDGKESSAVLVTHNEGNCTGLVYLHHPSNETGPCNGHIFFPNRAPTVHWSLIFHCHSEPFDEISDPFKRTYINGGALQESLEPQGPTQMCKHRLPRLSDGQIRLIYQGCKPYSIDFKNFDLPVDTCQSTLDSKGLSMFKPSTCSDGSRARRARYWDDECKVLHDITDIKDEDFKWGSCELLDIATPDVATRHIGSVALYCDGPAIQDIAEVTNRKEISLVETPHNTTIPRKPWWVPFWKGLILVSPGQGTGDFNVLSSDTCYNWIFLNSRLEIHQVPRCWDGTRANVAFFNWGNCIGSPVFYDGGDETLRDMRFCKSMPDCGGYDSMAFLCKGIGISKYNGLGLLSS
jgi:hypothetical protein